MDQLERMAITSALNQSGGNRTQAAIRLGISVRTLQRKLRQYEMDDTPKTFSTDVLAR
jgi:DNA-binding NtrC family response regulator